MYNGQMSLDQIVLMYLNTVRRIHSTIVFLKKPHYCVNPSLVNPISPLEVSK